MISREVLPPAEVTVHENNDITRRLCYVRCMPKFILFVFLMCVLFLLSPESIASESSTQSLQLRLAARPAEGTDDPFSFVIEKSFEDVATKNLEDPARKDEPATDRVTEKLKTNCGKLRDEITARLKNLNIANFKITENCDAAYDTSSIQYVGNNRYYIKAVSKIKIVF